MLILSSVLLFFGCVNAIPLGALPYRLEEELLHVPTTLIGQLPTWLSGAFVRQACGAFGPVGVNQTSPPQNIEHFFDCMGGLAVFHVDGSTNSVEFSSKLHRSHNYKVWESFGFDFAKSGQAWINIFGQYDHKRANQFANNWTLPTYLDSNPNIEMGMFGNQFQVLTEAPLMVGMVMNYTTMDMGGAFVFNDKLESQLAPTGADILINTPAHFAVDERGVQWSSVGHYQFNSASGGTVQLHLYTIENDVRTLVATYPIGSYQLSNCKGSSQTDYPDPSGRLSYMHSFAVTEHFVILPMSSVGWNPCNLFLPPAVGHQNQPRFSANWNVNSRPSEVVIFDRRTNEFHAIPTDAFFASHQAGAYDETADGDLQIHADMFTYDYSPYDSLRMEFFCNNFSTVRMDAKFERFTINTSDWSLKRSEFIPEVPVKDFPQINYAFSTKPYSYVYFLTNEFAEGSYVAKFNVQSNTLVKQWGPIEGYYFHEPIFIANNGENATHAEDDGVVVVGGFREDLLKGFMFVLDARTMESLAEVTAPQLTAPGLHNHFLQGL